MCVCVCVCVCLFFKDLILLQETPPGPSRTHVDYMEQRNYPHTTFPAQCRGSTLISPAAAETGSARGHCLRSGPRTTARAQRRLGPCPHTALHRTLLERSGALHSVTQQIPDMHSSYI